MGNESPLTTRTAAPVAVVKPDRNERSAPVMVSAPAGGHTDKYSARRHVSSGFVPRNETLHRLYNLMVVIPIIIMALPVMVVVAVALLFTQGPGILHFGERLGRNRQPFYMIKFRTLDSAAAQSLTRDRVLPRGSGLETPLGKFLRASRLDELPQLFNILLGDMNICGPRPVRPALAEIEAATSPHYDVRFRVKPGLVGHTQALMSHGASKRMRRKYNYLLCVSPVVYRRELALFLWVGLAVLTRALAEIWLRVRPWKDHYATAHEARRARRWQLGLCNGTSGAEMPVAGFSHERIILPERLLQPLPGPIDLIIRVHPAGIRKATISLTELGPVEGGHAYAYEPCNDVAAYMIDRYPMGEPAIAPRPRTPVLAPFKQTSRYDTETPAEGIPAK